MNASTRRQVLVGVDGSVASLNAVRWAAEDAALHQLPLHLINVLAADTAGGPSLGYGGPGLAKVRADSQAILDRAVPLAVKTASTIHAIEVTTEIADGQVRPILLGRTEDASMVVVGKHGLGTFHMGLLGSVSSALARHSRCPVAVVGDAPVPADPSGGAVLVGVDGSSNSEPALGVAFDEASHRRAELRALYAWSDVSESLAFAVDWQAVSTAEEMALAESLAGWQERHPDVHVQRIVVKDRPVRNLLARSQQAQLVVVGSHGRGGFAGMTLGSTSQALLYLVECPIIVVRGP
ncbi:universal stress protein [Rhodococcus maanshanensis]|uniref:universal stress protein n=1 Tax=Rhodococcus maanshanensis TaxID=183556 RepID=UPI0022B5DE68|nr:universal stress protein [Rhodococcus maanshanensis]MCZ4558745.1 universal stress protein [Rhodococcus maanshanensis]